MMASVKYIDCFWRLALCHGAVKKPYKFMIDKKYINTSLRTLVTHHRPMNCSHSVFILYGRTNFPTSSPVLECSRLSKQCRHSLHIGTGKYSDSAYSRNKIASTKGSGEMNNLDGCPQNTASPKKLDVDEEMLRYDYEEFHEQSDEVEEEDAVAEAEPIKLTRGKTGVFDIEDIVTILKEENVCDVCVIRIPPELRYVDYMLIGTGRSTRHITAVAEYIRWAYKRKRVSSDPDTVKIEGELSKDWLAIDLGNIAVHLFLKRTRELYDLEQLWSCGPEHDDKTRSVADGSSAAAFTFEEFSFDAELEKLRKVRQEQSVDNKDRQKI